MAVGDIGKKAIQFGRNVAYGLKGSTVGWAEGIGIRQIQANMTADQKKHLLEYGKKAEQAALKNGKTVKQAKDISRNARRELGERILAKQTTGYQVGDFLGYGVRNIYKNKKDGMPFDRAVQKAFTKTVKDDKGNLVKQLNAKAVAGTAVTAGMAARVASGGGLYKDRNGNTNLPVIPFI